MSWTVLKIYSIVKLILIFYSIIEVHCQKITSWLLLLTEIFTIVDTDFSKSSPVVISACHLICLAVHLICSAVHLLSFTVYIVVYGRNICDKRQTYLGRLVSLSPNRWQHLSPRPHTVIRRVI